MGHEAIVPFIIVSLAVYRCAMMVTQEDGPFYVFSTIRRKLMDWERRRGKPHWIIDGWHCPLCASFWLGFVGACIVPFSAWYDYLAIALALSGITLILKRKLG